MAPKSRAENASIIQALADQPYRFDFFHAVRRLENARADCPRVGESRRPQDDSVRFHQHVSLGFPPSSLHSYRTGGGSDPSRPNLWVNFLGLLGPGGPMPLSITEYVYNRVYNFGDRTLAAFLDMFNHRMIALFYRAWARCQQTVSHDRPEDDWFANYVGSFVGIGSEPFRGRDVLPDCLRLYYAGRLSCPTKNAEGLQAILEDHLGLPATIEEFTGQWVTLAPQDRCQLGGPARDVRLGETLVLGGRFWECQQKFRIRLGPMEYRDYMALIREFREDRAEDRGPMECRDSQTLIPGGASRSRVTAWVRFYLGDELVWEVQLVLAARDVRPVCLGQQGHLGWSCWLPAECPQKDLDDLVLTPLVA